MIKSVDDLDWGTINFTLQIDGTKLAPLLTPDHVKKINTVIALGGGPEDLKRALGECFNEIVYGRLQLATKGAKIMVLPGSGAEN